MSDHEKYMRLALEEARQALAANEFPVGCIMVSNGRVVASGRRSSSTTFATQESANELDHAEIVALRDLLSNHPTIDRAGITVYSTMEPCLMCFSTLLLNNICHIVYGYEDVMGGGTDLPLQQLRPLYRAKKITVTPHVMRQSSLELFQRFFASPHNRYWQDSLLAQYTLQQSPRTP